MASISSINLGQPTHIARKNGDWFDPNTWQSGKVPGKSANVWIGQGVSVFYNGQSDARLSSVKIDGALSFAPTANNKIVLDTMAVSANGKLQIGSENRPVQGNTEVWITADGPLNLSQDPQQLGRGIIAEGAVEIHGLAKTSHLKVARDPQAGDRTLTLQGTPQNWQVGDRIVLTGTRFIADAGNQDWGNLTQDEEVVIAAIDGNTLTLDRALQYDHDTPRNDLKAYVANQSRNILIATENGRNLPPAQRGHTLFTGKNEIDIRYAEFRGLGRTDKSRPLDDFQTTGGKYPERLIGPQGKPIPGARKNIAGRYAVHIHQKGTTGNPAIVVGNVVDDSPGWGFVVHESSAILESNVAYGVAGGAFVTESGNETGAFRNNISINTGSTLDTDSYIEKQGVGTHDFARTGVGFWFQGRLVEAENNVAASSRNAGMFYFHRGIDLKPVTVSDFPVPGLAKKLITPSTMSVDQAPIQGFKNNEVLASGVGLHVIKDVPQQQHDLRTVMDGFKGWEVERGTELQYTAHYTLNNFDLLGSEASTQWKNKGLKLQKITQDVVFHNMRVQGFDKGISVQPSGGEGPAGLTDRQLVWIDLQLTGNNADFENFSLPPDKWLSQADLKPGRLSFQPSEDSDLIASENESRFDGVYAELRGTKTDSLGTIEVPFGDEQLAFNYQGIQRLAQQGYYTLADGRRVGLVEEYFSDRVTGEIIKYPFLITFQESSWTDGSPYLGDINPNTLGGPTSVRLPGSRFQLKRQQPEAAPLLAARVTIANPDNSGLAADTGFLANDPLLTRTDSNNSRLLAASNTTAPLQLASNRKPSNAVSDGLARNESLLLTDNSALPNNQDTLQLGSTTGETREQLNAGLSEPSPLITTAPTFIAPNTASNEFSG